MKPQGPQDYLDTLKGQHLLISHTPLARDVIALDDHGNVIGLAHKISVTACACPGKDRIEMTIKKSVMRETMTENEINPRIPGGGHGDTVTDWSMTTPVGDKIGDNTWTAHSPIVLICPPEKLDALVAAYKAKAGIQ